MCATLFYDKDVPFSPQVEQFQFMKTNGAGSVEVDRATINAENSIVAPRLS